MLLTGTIRSTFSCRVHVSMRCWPHWRGLDVVRDPAKTVLGLAVTSGGAEADAAVLSGEPGVFGSVAPI